MELGGEYIKIIGDTSVPLQVMERANAEGPVQFPPFLRQLWSRAASAALIKLHTM